MISHIKKEGKKWELVANWYVSKLDGNSKEIPNGVLGRDGNRHLKGVKPRSRYPGIQSQVSLRKHHYKQS